MYKYLVFFLVLNYYSLGDTRAQGKELVDTLWIDLAYEYCGFINSEGRTQFSMCTDGYGQVYNLPKFVRLNFDNFRLSYNDTTYDLSCVEIEGRSDFLKDFNLYEILDSMIIEKNLVSFKNNRIKRHYRRSSLMPYFDGRFYYGLFRLHIVRSLRSNKVTIFKLDSKGFRIPVKVPQYCIIAILSMEPIDRIEYIDK